MSIKVNDPFRVPGEETIKALSGMGFKICIKCKFRFDCKIIIVRLNADFGVHSLNNTKDMKGMKCIQFHPEQKSTFRLRDPISKLLVYHFSGKEKMV